MTVHLVLPALDEEVGLPRTVRALSAALADVPHRFVVVDDGSTDGTAAAARRLAREHPLELVSHPENRGLGAAIASGLRAACEGAAADDVLITLDADDTQPAGLAPRLAALIDRGCELAIASRYRGGGRVVGVGRGRKLISAVVSLLLRALLPVPGVTDYSSGYRAYRVGLLRTAWAASGPGGLGGSPGFVVQLQILLQLARLRRLRVGELPILLRYDRKRSPTRLRVGRTGRELVGIVWRELRRRRWPGAPAWRRHHAEL